MAFPHKISFTMKARTAALLFGERASNGYLVKQSLSTWDFPSFLDKMKRRSTSEMLLSFNSTLVSSAPNAVFA